MGPNEMVVKVLPLQKLSQLRHLLLRPTFLFPLLPGNQCFVLYHMLFLLVHLAVMAVSFAFGMQNG